VAIVSNNEGIAKAVDELKIPRPQTVIVLIGGAGGIDAQHKSSIEKAISIVAKLAEETDSIVIDGGTQAGVMLEIGKQRKQKEYYFPLIGVLPSGKLAQKEPQSILELNHTHFILSPGDNWGDESTWIAKIATILSGNKRSITILINGGRVSKNDVDSSLLEKRTTIIMRGTGRLADEIILSQGIFEVNVTQPVEEILAILRVKLS
jgi:hypothetical protein